MSTRAHYAAVPVDGWEQRFTGIERLAELQMAVARELIGPGQAKRVLDIGCGTGRMASLVPGATYTGVDITPAFIEHARVANGGPGRTYFVGDMDRLPFNDGSFDLVVLMGTLEAEPDLQRRIEGLARLVAPGGTLFFNVQNKRNLPGRFANLFGRHYRQRFWSRRQVLSSVGSGPWVQVSVASVLLLPPGAARTLARLAGFVPGLERAVIRLLLAAERANLRRDLGWGYEWQVALRR